MFFLTLSVAVLCAAGDPARADGAVTLCQARPPLPPRPDRDRRLRRDRVANVFSHGSCRLGAADHAAAAVGGAQLVQERRRDPHRPVGAAGAAALGNWARAWSEAHIGRYFLNSAIVVAGALILTMLLGAMAAYVLARYGSAASGSSTTVRRRDDVPGLPGAGAAVLRGAQRSACSARCPA